jgi:hypothetical protein
MTRRNLAVSTLMCLISLAIVCGAFAQQPTQAPAQQGQMPTARTGERAAPPAVVRPPLFFRLDWTQPAAAPEHPLTQDGVGNSNLELKLYGLDGKDMQILGNAQEPINNPVHLWTGVCTSPCGLGLRDKNNYVDLTGLAKIRWYTRVAGFHLVRPIVKLADGTWLVGDRADGSTLDWIASEFYVSEVHWRKLDSDRMVTSSGGPDWVEKPDLSKVDEVGFTDLMPGSGHGTGGWIQLGGIEVYGKPVPRAATTSSR